jgi:hypothetical protein
VVGSLHFDWIDKNCRESLPVLLSEEEPERGRIKGLREAGGEAAGGGRPDMRCWGGRAATASRERRGDGEEQLPNWDFEGSNGSRFMGRRNYRAAI